MTTVHQAWAAVMGDVQAVSKDGRNTQQNFNFRGIDSVMNAVGPALRAHGVTVVPSVIDYAMRTYTTGRNQTTMANYVVTVRFEVFGPEGDSFYGITLGEASDAGDKAVSKAHSVALRTFLLQSLTIPTDEPDPDESSHERDPEHGPEPEPEVDDRVNVIAERIKSWPEGDERLQEMLDARAKRGWPGKLGDYTDEQLTDALKLVNKLDERGETAPEPQQQVEDVPSEEAVPPAPDAGQEGDGDGAEASTEAPSLHFSRELMAKVTGDQITAAARALKLDVPSSGSKSLRLQAFSAQVDQDTPEGAIDLIHTVAKETADA